MGGGRALRGITYWLALRAGVQRVAADCIAGGNVDADRGILDARRTVFWYARLGNEPVNLELVRWFHFPSFVKTPNPSAARKVEVGGRAASEAVEMELARRPWHGASGTFCWSFH